jgi:hypothetical protein
MLAHIAFKFYSVASGTFPTASTQSSAGAISERSEAGVSPVPTTKQTFPAELPKPPPGGQELGAQVVSQVAQYQPCGAGQWQRIQRDLENDIGLAMDTRALRLSSVQ